MTCRLQALDQGIIRSVKCKYHINLFLKTLDGDINVEVAAFAKWFLLLDYLEVLKNAWTDVSIQTKGNCFCRALVKTEAVVLTAKKSIFSFFWQKFFQEEKSTDEDNLNLATLYCAESEIEVNEVAHKEPEEELATKSNVSKK